MLAVEKLNERIIGPHICLRPITQGDAEAMTQCAQNPSMAPNLQFFSNTPPNYQQEFAWVTAIRREMRFSYPNNWVYAIESSTGEFIGTVGVHEIDHKNNAARFGILIMNARFRKRGIASEILDVLFRHLFEVVGMHKIYTSFSVLNEGMRTRVEKFGFREVGVLQEEYYLRGVYLDFVRYELLENSWRLNNSSGQRRALEDEWDRIQNCA